jgi:hypothetical protein
MTFIKSVLLRVELKEEKRVFNRKLRPGTLRPSYYVRTVEESFSVFLGVRPWNPVASGYF